MRKQVIVIVMSILVIPGAANAAVLINEIAWMGTAANANAEWIELTNNGSTSVDLTNWHLIASSGSPSLALTGSIATNGYFLLERTSDATVPNVAADQIYTGALTNSGTTLTLTDAQGSTVDQVVGGTNWVNVGGDNTTKETAQRTSGGWTTAQGTPRAINFGVSNSSQATQSSSVTTQASSSSSSEGVAEYMPIPTLYIKIGGSRSGSAGGTFMTVSAGADTTYSAVVYDSRGNVRTDAVVTWSFGDGMRRTGASVFHAYYEPGEYVAIVRATTSDKGEAYAEVMVTVKQSFLTITAVSEKGVSLTNNDSRTIDISFWRMRAGEKEFKFPEDTYIRSMQTVLFSSKIIQLPLTSTLGVPQETVQLVYPNGDVADSFPRTQTVAQLTLPNGSYTKVQEVDSFTNVGKNVQLHDEAVAAPALATKLLASAGAALPTDDDPGLSPESPSPDQGSSNTLKRLLSSPWTLGFLGVVLLAGGAFIFH